ncbi:MAG: ATP-grasp domain-containing protein [Candidatus Pacebacteria bacterium]|nr:ATP-grasp domain-containing protein [Candidatus Paceibacterota bacterium]
MQKIVLLLGGGLLPKFEKHILKINPALTPIECSFNSEIPQNDSDNYLFIPEGKEFETIVEYAKDKEVVGIINRKDYYESLHGQLVDHFQVPGPSFHSVDQVSNKANLHELMEELNLQLFRPRTITCQLSEVPTLLKSVQFPVIIKPFAGAHSRGVHKLESVADFDGAYPYLYEHFKKEMAVDQLDSQDKTVLIEEYLPGKMVVPICYVDRKHKVHFISLLKVVSARDVGQDHYQLIFRTTPSNTPEPVQQKMRFILQKIARATRLKETFLDPEFFVHKGHVYLIEINVRMGGFRQELAKPAFDIDLEKMITQLALKQDVEDQFNAIGSATACEIWEPESGTIKQLKLPKSKHITWSKLNFVPGDYYEAPPAGNKPLGSFYITASEKSLSIAKKIRSKVVIEFEDNK